METANNPHSPHNPHRGRGTSTNPKNRFHLESSQVEETEPPESVSIPTQFLTDHSKTILSFNKSPDLPYDVGVNVYRGCEHGCTYCYARPTHEYLGYSSGLDFETKILVKHSAADQLHKQLSSPSWKPQIIVMSGVTDPYQPIEQKLQLTRKCLKVLAICRNPVSIITKNYLVTRDHDLLAELARFQAVRVHLSINSLDATLASQLEPRASTPKRRLQAIETLARKNIPTSVMVAPIIPGLNEKDIPHIIQAVKNAGASSASYTLLRLPHQNTKLFETWLTTYYPLRKQKVMQRLMEARGGKVNSSTFYERFRGHGPYAHMIRSMFHIACKKYDLSNKSTPLNTKAFRRQDPLPEQLSLL